MTGSEYEKRKENRMSEDLYNILGDTNRWESTPTIKHPILMDHHEI
jgi:hypothetical protein